MKSTRRVVIAGALVSVAGVSVNGCAVDVGGDQEPIGTVQQASCTSGTPDETGTYPGTSALYSDYATNYYGTNCSDTWLAEFDGLQGENFTLTAGWRDALPDNRDDCEDARVTTTMSTYAGMGWWWDRGSVTCSGEWSYFFGGWACRMNDCTGSLTATYSNAPFDKARISVKAWQEGGNYRRAQAGVLAPQ